MSIIVLNTDSVKWPNNPHYIHEFTDSPQFDWKIRKMAQDFIDPSQFDLKIRKMAKDYPQNNCWGLAALHVLKWHFHGISQCLTYISTTTCQRFYKLKFFFFQLILVKIYEWFFKVEIKVVCTWIQNCETF